MMITKPWMKIKKPWGWEEILVMDRYVVKRLHVSKGCRTSLQRHERKVETWIYPDGSIKHIEPGTVHRLEAFGDDLEIIEVSTTELDDVSRILDDYGRT